MSAQFPTQGETNILKRLTGVIANGPLSLRLFVAPSVISVTDVLATYTEPPTSSGYAPISLTPNQWTFSTVGPSVTASYPPVGSVVPTFSFTGSAGPLLGYLVVDPVASNVVWSELFAGPLTMPSQGGTLGVPVNVTAKNC